ncbi:MAG: type VI secretion system baseplate subunit TssG [Endozoicomonas sp.]|uniref:type VI secretion system baseplate subunit TssG n=1 Tax=Endozoicomonas sp. TaxID=1892382 RepID=UPI003D9B545E
MYTPSWLSDQSLKQSLTQTPERWQYTQAIRVLSLTGQPCFSLAPPSYQFPGRELAQIVQTKEGWRLDSYLPSLFGFYSVIPYYLQDIEQHQRTNLDKTDIYSFFSLLNHRTLTMAADVKTRSNLGLRYEQRQITGHTLVNTLLAISGTPELLNLQNTEGSCLIRYNATLGRTAKDMKKFAAILSDYFSIKVTAHRPKLERQKLSSDCLTRLRTSPSEEEQHLICLGKAAPLGQYCFLPRVKARLEIEINNPEEFQAVYGDHTLIPAMHELSARYFGGSRSVCLTVRCPRRLLQAPRISSHPSLATVRLNRYSCLCPELHPDQYVVVALPEVCPNETA